MSWLGACFTKLEKLGCGTQNRDKHVTLVVGSKS